MLQLQHPLRCFAGQDLGAGLIGQVVGALDGVEGMVFPGVVLALRMVAQRGVDPALGCPGVGADRVHLGEHGHAASAGVGFDGCPQAR